jgi:flagellar biosynthesis protein FlhF
MATTTQKPSLRTFHGPTMAEALAKVKRDLGPDAVIVHTRTFREGGVLGVGAREMVEITASDDARVVRPRRPGNDAPQRRAQPLPDTLAASAPEEPFIPTPPWFARPAPKPEPERGRKATASAHAHPQPEAKPPTEPLPEPRPKPRAIAETKPPRPEPDSPGPEAQPGPPRRLEATRVDPAPTNPTARAALEEELAAIRRLVGQVLQSSRRVEARAGIAEAPSDASGPLFDLALRLHDHQVSPETVDALCAALHEALSPAEMADPQVVRDAMLRQIARRIPVTGAPVPPPRSESGRPTVVALVGPTGVGKTTTVAKLAAACKLRHGRKVGLITADTYRIAAVEQLRTYADIVGLPLKVALAPADVREAVDALASCDLILLDSAGRSQRDDARLDELAEFLHAARPDQTHLVLSLASAESVMVAAAKRYARLGPDRMILTKLDEAVDYGPVLNVAMRIGLPCSFVATGQEVPDDLAPADADRLARLVLDGDAAWQAVARSGR